VRDLARDDASNERADVRTCGRADVRTCGRADVRTCGRADVRTCGQKEKPNSRRIWRRQICFFSALQHIRTSARQHVRTSPPSISPLYQPKNAHASKERRSMKFDLLYELQIPKPHDERSEYRCYQEALEQIELADRLGFDTVWAVEHHFLTEFAHSSAPEVFLAAVSQRTKRIRIGHGVVLLPHKVNHPVPVAERAAALHILSNGRPD